MKNGALRSAAGLSTECAKERRISGCVWLRGASRWVRSRSRRCREYNAASLWARKGKPAVGAAAAACAASITHERRRLDHTSLPAALACATGRGFGGGFGGGGPLSARWTVA